MRNGRICEQDFIWTASEVSQVYVCVECLRHGLRMMLDTKLRFTQNEKEN